MSNPEIDKDGTKRWWKNGLLHREDGPAIENISVDKCWYKNGRLYNEDGRRLKFPYGKKEWYQNGKLHREDGPAEEWSNGDKCWSYYGKRIECSSQEEFENSVRSLLRLKAFW